MAASQAEQLLEKIQKEIAELKKNEAELDKLCHTEDHVHFLQVIPLRLMPQRLIFLSNFQDSNTDSNSLSLLVFQSCQSLHAPPVLSALPSVTVDPSLTFGPVMTAVSDFKGLLQEVCQGGFVCIYERGRYKRLYQISVFICHKLFCQLLFYMFSSFCPLQ